MESSHPAQSSAKGVVSTVAQITPFPWPSAGRNHCRPGFCLRVSPLTCAPASQGTLPPPGMACWGKSEMPGRELLAHAPTPRSTPSLLCPPRSGERLPLDRRVELLFAGAVYRTQPAAEPPTATGPTSCPREGPAWPSPPDAHPASLGWLCEVVTAKAA